MQLGATYHPLVTVARVLLWLQNWLELSASTQKGQELSGNIRMGADTIQSLIASKQRYNLCCQSHSSTKCVTQSCSSIVSVKMMLSR
jgi:hypothetical protein